MSAARHRIQLWGFRLALHVSRALPRRALLAAGGGLGRLFGQLDRRHRRIALDNLALALGIDADGAQGRRIVSRCWAHFGRVVLDSLCFPRWSPAAIGVVVRYEGWEHIRRAYARGRGVLLFSAHFGHWELAALMQGYGGLPLALVARPLDNPLLDREVRRLRCLSGNVIIPHRGAARPMLKTLRAGGGVAIVIDQDARHSGVFVPFFGRPASTTPALASLALKTGAAVVPVYSVPRDDGSYRVVYEAPLPVESTGDHEADVRRITAACTATIERWVRRRPEYWLWMHRRWKTRPPEGQQTLRRTSAEEHT